MPVRHKKPILTPSTFPEISLRNITLFFYPNQPTYKKRNTMSVSETNTPASTSTSATATEEKNAPTLAEMVRKYKTKELIDFLRKEEDLELSETAIKILEKEEITGRAFLKITEEKLRSYGMPGGLQTLLTSLRNLASVN